jgi:CRISPR-associated protein Csb1
MDPVNLTGLVDDTAKAEGNWSYVAEGTKAKGTKLSEIGHGNIPPNPVPGGVTVREIRRIASISFAGLERQRFGEPGRRP